ncbi:MAG: SufD family Fe-S cluster assembly protein [Pseudomonadota bacterium]
MNALADMIPNATPAELDLIERYASLPADPRRERAFQAFAAGGLPHRRMEAWRWTDFKAGLKSLEAASAAPQADPFATVEAPVIVFDGGKLSAPDGLPAGLKLIERPTVDAYGAAEDLPLGALAAALSDSPNGLIVEATDIVDTPLRFVFRGDGQIAFARIEILVREGASLEMLESHLGGAAFSASALGAKVEAGGALRRTLFQAGAANEAQAITASVELDAAARYAQTALSFGAKLARLETRLVHQGEGAEAVLNAAYLLGDGYHADLTSFVRHGAPACVTKQSTKGAVRDGGRGVFQGKFHVPRVGQKTDADMQHNALLLEDGAEVDAKPELEIYADDVACAHGNTAGALDADALFYMRQRGLPETDARALLTEAFIVEALEEAGAGEEALLVAARAWLAA